MMTKGTFFLNETLRKGAPMVTDVGHGAFMARARLPFPQGLQFLYKVFQGRPLADVYSHGYFIEKQSNPDQPSPQFHLTEEMQGIMRVMKGLIYMNDISSRLDNAMTVVKDPRSEKKIRASGKAGTAQAVDDCEWIMYNPIELDEKTLPALRQRLTGSTAYLSPKLGVDEDLRSEAEMKKQMELRERVKHKISTIIVPSQQTFGKIGFWMEEFPNAKIIASGPSIPPRVAEELFAGKTEEEKAAMLKRFTFVTPSPVLTPVPVGGVPGPAEGKPGGFESPMHSPHASLYPDNAANTFTISPDSIVDPADGIIDLCAGEDTHGAGSCLLRRVPGDALTNELVMLHEESKSLACTDLFHGAYADFDPLNTWMCRAWFKFNRDGDYKDARILPLFRRRQIEAQNGGSVEKGGKGLEVMQHFVRELVESDKNLGGRNLQIICHSHGTPPSRDRAGETLLAQYDLHKMDKYEMSGFDVTSQNMFAAGRV